MKELVGKNIVSIHLNSASDIVYFTDSEGKIYSYEARGDCCSTAYIEHINNVEFALGIVRSINRAVVNINSDEDSCDCLDAYYYNISTDKGTATLEMRLSHNGYYGGWLEFNSVDSTSGNLIAGSLTFDPRNRIAGIRSFMVKHLAFNQI